MKVAIGADHGGYSLKEDLKHLLEDMGVEYKDFGTHSTDSVDYPDIAVPVAQAVAAGEFDRGILVCGTGIGIGIAANKVPGIRAALVHDTLSAHACREHGYGKVCFSHKHKVNREPYMYKSRGILASHAKLSEQFGRDILYIVFWRVL